MTISLNKTPTAMARKLANKTVCKAGLVSAFAILATLSASAGQEYAFEIAADRTDKTLFELAKAASVQIVFAPEVASQTQSPAIQGTQSLAEALTAALAGTNLVYEFKSDDFVVVKAGNQSGAQSSDDLNVEHEQGNVFVLEEIIVTAEKRAESLQDIPIAISAFSGDRMERAGAVSIANLQQISPSIQVGSDGPQTFISVRGIGTEVYNIGGESGVTVSQDDVVLSQLSMLDADFLDVDRVEVLRGPQGTISGRNATGGALNIHSNLPTEEFEAGIKATLGNYSRYAMEHYLSGPIGESGILGRFAFSTDQADGWLKNTFLNEELNTRDKTHARASFLTDMSPDIEALLILDWIKDRSTRNGLILGGRARPDMPFSAEFLGVPGPNLEDLTFESDVRHETDKEQFGATMKLTWDIVPTATLTSTTGYISFDLHQTYDCDGIRLSYCGFPAPAAFPYGVDFNVWQVSQELTLAADLTDRLDLLLGTLYLHSNSDEPLYAEGTDGIVPAGLFDINEHQVLDSWAAYTQLRYRVTDKLRLTAGARYTLDEKDYREDGLIFVPVAVRVSDSWRAFTPRFAIDYTPTDDLTLYASVSRGFKSGGFNNFTGGVDAFDPEYVWNYEAGAKASLFDDRLRLSGAAFFMDYTNIQQTIFLGPLPTVENASGAEILGLELELDALVTDALRLSFAGAWLDTEFTELRSNDNIFPELGERDLSGNRLPRAPEWKFSISGEYTKPLTDNLIGVLGADYTWQSDVFWTYFNHELVSQGSYGLLNLHAAIESEDGRWSVMAFGRNLFDKRYFTNMTADSGGLLPAGTATRKGALGAPRMYGISLAYKF